MYRARDAPRAAGYVCAMPATAFLLAAGLGTRLRPLTNHLPKPLVPVCGVPMLDFALAHVRAHGHAEVIVNAHWLPEAVEAWARGHRDVHVSVELPEVLGTGGGLKAVRDRLAERFVIVNGDVISDVDLTALMARVRPGGAAMALRHAPEAGGYGIVAADATGTLVRLVDVARAVAEGPVDETTHFTGIHAMDRRMLDLVPDGFACVVRTAYRAVVPQRLVGTLVHDGLWLDIGDPAGYLAANLAALRGDLALPLDPFDRAAAWRSSRGSAGDPPGPGRCWVGPRARVTGAFLDDAVIGARARVADGVTVRRSVVWDDCVVEDDVEDAIVYPGGVLRAG